MNIRKRILIYIVLIPITIGVFKAIEFRDINGEYSGSYFLESKSKGSINWIIRDTWFSKTSLEILFPSDERLNISDIYVSKNSSNLILKKINGDLAVSGFINQSFCNIEVTDLRNNKKLYLKGNHGKKLGIEELNAKPNDIQTLLKKEFSCDVRDDNKEQGTSSTLQFGLKNDKYTMTVKFKNGEYGEIEQTDVQLKMNGNSIEVRIFDPNGKGIIFIEGSYQNEKLRLVQINSVVMKSLNFKTIYSCK